MKLLEKLEHRIEQNLHRRYADMQVNTDFVMPADAIRDRQFSIRTADKTGQNLTYKGRNITLVSIESGMPYVQGRNDFVPNDWQEQLACAMDTVDLAFVEYLPTELRNTAYKDRVTGRAYQAFGENMVEPIYQPIADLARDKGIPLAVSDIGNRRAYLFYDFSPVDRFSHNYMYSARQVKPTQSERYIPSGVDARRMFTAEGMKKTIEEMVPVGGSVMYIAAPAHVNRVEKYLTEKPMMLDKARQLLYKNIVFGVDPTTRIYQHDGTDWELTARSEPYYTPGKQLKPAAMAAGVAVALGAAAAHKFKKHRRKNG